MNNHNGNSLKKTNSITITNNDKTFVSSIRYVRGGGALYSTNFLLLSWTPPYSSSSTPLSSENEQINEDNVVIKVQRRDANLK